MARGLVLLAFCPLFAALYPLTQLYQLEEDTRRGDRTLACVLGVRRSLDAAIAAAALAFALFAAAGIRAGWRAGGPDCWRWAGLALALARLGLRCCSPGGCTQARLAPADHQRGMYRALGAWAVTDVVGRAGAGAPDGPLAGPRDGYVYFDTSSLSPETACTRQWNCARTTT